MAFEYKPQRATSLKVNESRCRAEVSNEAGVGFHQCRHKAKYDGKWCGTHRPGAAEERSKKRGPTKWELKWERAYCEAKYVKHLEDGLKNIRDGDVRGTPAEFAKNVLAEAESILEGKTE